MTLLIPVQVLDVLNPHAALGLYGIVGLSPRRDDIKDGRHLVGEAQGAWPDGTRFRRYWFYAELGKKGGYGEIPAEEPASIPRRGADIVYSEKPLDGASLPASDGSLRALAERYVRHQQHTSEPQSRGPS